MFVLIHKLIAVVVIATAAAFVGVVGCFNYELVKTFFQYYSVNMVTVLHCNVNDMDILGQAKQFTADNFIVNFKSISSNESFSDIEEFPRNPQQYHEGLLVDPSCKEIGNLILNANFHRKFTGRQFWLFELSAAFNDNNTTEKESLILESEIGKADVFPNSQVVWIESSDTDFRLYDIYRITKNTPIITTLVGESDISNLRFALNDLTQFRLTRQDFRSTELQAAIVIQYPKSFSYLGDIHQRGYETFLKRTYPSMEILREDLNFRIGKMKITDGFGWITNRSGIFDGGMMGLLQTNEIDFAMHHIIMRVDRYLACDFAAELTQTTAKIIYRQPPLSSISNIYVLPFSGSVWLSLTLLILVVSAVIVFELGLVPDHATENLSLGDLLTFVTGAICQQGFSLSPSTLSTRLTVLILFTASLFLFTSYSANIVALLQSPSSSIKTLADLVSSPLGVGIQNITYNLIFIRESKHAVTQHLYHKKIVPNGDKAFLSVPQGIANMRRGMYAFQVDTGAAYDEISATFTEGEKCGLAEVELYQLPRQAVPMQKHSPYRDIFAVRLRWQREVGLVDRVAKIWVPQKPICESSASGFVSVGSTEARPAVKTYIFCTIAAVLLFILEIIHHRYYQRF